MVMPRVKSGPVTAEIRKALVRYIDQLQASGGTRLPSELAMASSLGVSRIALREVLKELQQEGMIVSLHGKGTFISRDMQRLKVRLTPAVEFEQAIRSSGYEAQVELVSVGVVAPESYVREALDLAEGECIYLVRKIFYADGNPVIFCEDMFPAQLFGDEPVDPVELEDSTFEFLLKRAGVVVVNDVAELLARDSNTLGGFGPGYFSVPKPLLLLRSVYYTAKHRPALFVNANLDTDYIKLSILRRQDVYSPADED